MKTRNMILSGSILGILVVLLAINTVMADTPPMGTEYGNADPEIYFLKKGFGFCQRYGENQLPEWLGGSTPDGMDLQTAGCIEWEGGERSQSYAFSGEQIAELVVARDANGVEDLTNAYLLVDGYERVKCIPISKHFAEDLAEAWGYDDLDDELELVPHETVLGAGHIGDGFKEDYDQIYKCVLTVTDDMGGMEDSQVDITVKVYDESLAEDETDPQVWDFNPEVTLDISGDVTFPLAPAGSIVYSSEKLVIKNGGEKVAIAVWLGGTDLYGDAAARCPMSNVLDVDKYMEFRCTLNDGIYIDEQWDEVYNKDLTDEDGCYLAVENEVDLYCFGLEPLFDDFGWFGPDTTPEERGNILFPGDKAECEFKLEYPVPCVGTFTEGNLIILMRAI